MKHKKKKKNLCKLLLKHKKILHLNPNNENLINEMMRKDNNRLKSNNVKYSKYFFNQRYILIKLKWLKKIIFTTKFYFYN